MVTTLLEWGADAAGWAHGNPRAALLVVAALAVVKVVLDSNLTWVYRISTKDGEAVRVGITRFGRYRRRMREYRTGKDSSTRKGDAWQRRVRWWTPPVPARLARWLGRCGESETGVWPGWWRHCRTVELHLTRRRALAYEDVQIKAVRPRHNHQGKPRVPVRGRRGKVAA